MARHAINVCISQNVVLVGQYDLPMSVNQIHEFVMNLLQDYGGGRVTPINTFLADIYSTSVFIPTEASFQPNKPRHGARDDQDNPAPKLRRFEAVMYRGQELCRQYNLPTGCPRELSALAKGCFLSKSKSLLYKCDYCGKDGKDKPCAANHSSYANH